MKNIVFTFAFIFYSLICFSESTPVKDSSLTKTCAYTKYYFSDGKLKEEGCLINGKREGLWKEYNENGWQRFEWTYFNGKKDGPYKSLFKSGKTQTIGKYKNNAIADTLKTFDENGNLIELTVWKVIDGSKSKVIYQKSFDSDKKPDGTKETIDGKKYIWIDGKKIEL